LGFCLAPQEERTEPLPMPSPAYASYRAQLFVPHEVWNASGLYEPMGGAVLLRYDTMETPWPRHTHPGEMVRPELRNEFIGPAPKESQLLILAPSSR